MTGKEIAGVNIITGDASRYIKPSWVEGGSLSTAAFDLRDGPPPENYVSHFMAEGQTLDEKFRHAYGSISARITKCDRGGIALLDVAEVLSEVNDETQDLVMFREAGLPHCGLYFLCLDPQDRLEVKATLCFIASRRLAAAVSIRVGDEIAHFLPASQ